MDVSTSDCPAIEDIAGAGSKVDPCKVVCIAFYSKAFSFKLDVVIWAHLHNLDLSLFPNLSLLACFLVCGRCERGYEPVSRDGVIYS